jgi:cobalt-zinc-cadmium resistance protein CzcA
MLDKIIYLSIQNKFIVGLLTVGLVVVGLYAAVRLPIDALPDITNNQVQVITTSPSLATQEVEQMITYPIELALKPIPGILELRSVSRFGLSVVTVVFEERVDIYWARAQISERLREVEKAIPPTLGSPEMAPVSTGLGEIYQYVVFPKEGYAKRYDAMALRTIQDWIIRPQLLGTKGVAEVNTLGGRLKEYEVAVEPDKLKAMNTTIVEIFDALTRNNENTGGAYIDKKPYAYFIRGIGRVADTSDIQKIVVKTQNGIPILVRDVAKVGIGSSLRYGAVTKDGQGEEVSGMVMMLKGENSAEVVARVKAKMEQIRKSLPEGVAIEPFMDRTKLVDKAIGTVATNLLEGALIVIFILVLLLGNLRAGLVVASVIPLALLFAVTMMYLFGVSGNLMSLGAIDFGLIVDGAVIIVEAIIHRLQITPPGRLSEQEMDKTVYGAAARIRSSAAFGEIIILIVYLPILALVGIEGKMFGPMAQTVSFAILGAFILSLTYVPMMSALVLKKQGGHKVNISDRIIAQLQRAYAPVLAGALRLKAYVLAGALVLLLLAGFVFSTLGGEFIPTLDEGDIATHLIISPGSSLSQEIEATTKAELLLKAQFPEIKMIVSKIGSAEIPTDPMPIEAADMIIVLKDKREWTSAKTKEELMAKMEKALEAIPGAVTEFSQPIQMRFNELMTGVRSDVAIKIFGEDLDLLVSKGEEVVALIHDVDGVVDAKAERVAGLPQITVRYNKDKLALYGLNVDDLNRVIRTGFAGAVAGVVYEGEQRFNMVVRLAAASRADIHSLKTLFIPLPSGNQIPLEQVADIDYAPGPMQISREEGKRRIVVGFNVRGRDVQSVVDEISQKLDAELDLPAGYYPTFGGQFQNLVEANRRLAVAVPVALLLIFVLLFFTFHSVKQSLLIFTAIPFSAIGGVFALWLRDMPFSISAGVGFIALFGVAVLNGIVLLGSFNHLLQDGVTDVYERIQRGTRERLRPVIMTAAVASLGFLPMALSTGAGAEVQKPLATVVIGGLISATLLTLVVLPILYDYLERSRLGRLKLGRGAVALLVLLFLPGLGQAQAPTLPKYDLASALDIGMRQHGAYLAATLETKSQAALEKTAVDLPKTTIGGTFGQYNTRAFDHNYSISQQFSPFSYGANKTLLAAQTKSASYNGDIILNEMVLAMRQTWNELQYLREQGRMLARQDSLVRRFAEMADLKYQTGETNLLEKTSASHQQVSIEQAIRLNTALYAAEKSRLRALMQLDTDFELEEEPYEPIAVSMVADSSALEENPLLLHTQQQAEIAAARLAVEKAELLPEFSAGYFIQSLRGNQEVNGQTITYDGTPRFQGATFAVSVPLFSRSQVARVEASKISMEAQAQKVAWMQAELSGQVEQQLQIIRAYKSLIDYQKATALPNAALIKSHATKAYQGGDISYVEFLRGLETAWEIESAHLKAIHDYNEAANQLQFLLND